MLHLEPFLKYWYGFHFYFIFSITISPFYNLLIPTASKETLVVFSIYAICEWKGTFGLI